MAIMDISEVGPLLRGLAGLLKPDGRLVFSVLHPCFNFHGATMVAEEQQKDSDLVVTYSIKVTDYADDVATLGVAMKGQPTPHYYFHRPLGELFSACFEAGLVLDGLREPVFGADATPGHPVGWGDYRTVPPVMVARLRRGA